MEKNNKSNQVLWIEEQRNNDVNQTINYLHGKKNSQEIPNAEIRRTISIYYPGNLEVFTSTEKIDSTDLVERKII